MPGRVMEVATNGALLVNGAAHGSISAKEEGNAMQPYSEGRKASRDVDGSAANGLHTGDDPVMHSGPMPVLGLHSPPPDLGLPDEFWENILSQFMPLSRLFQRSAQRCMNRLDETITHLSSLGASPAGSTNGVMVNGSGSQAASISIEKKRSILSFANDQREMFIKLLVISQWTQKANTDLKQLIKLRSWLQWRMDDVVNTAAGLSTLKADLQSFKEPNPDIRTALEVLSTGLLSWLPSYDYIPPPKVSTTEMIRTLHDLNVLISLRLNLHEDVPTPLKQYTIADGRVTFAIPGQFDFDLTIADEDPTMPWYFLDVRFNFKPTIEIPHGSLRAGLEDRVNAVLSDSGLRGAFEFLHDLTLTYKLSILRRQAYEMRRSIWADSLNIEMVHRSLIIQYWTTLSVKSWIEIGVARNRSESSSWKEPQAPKLSMRWFKAGIEVKDAHMDFDWGSLDLESLLRRVISQHTFSNLQAISESLSELDGVQYLEALSLRASGTQQEDQSLVIELRGQTFPATLRQEPVSGNFTLQPASVLASQFESRLNNHSRQDVAPGRLVAEFCVRGLQRHTEDQAVNLGWKNLKHLRVNNLASTLTRQALSVSFYRAAAWGVSSWIMAATYSLAGELWWAVQIEDAALGLSVKDYRQIAARYHDRNQDPYSTEPLRRIESLTVALASIAVNSNVLRELGVPHGLTNETQALQDSETLTDAQLSVDLIVTLVANSEKLTAAKCSPTIQLDRHKLRINVLGFQRSSKLVHYYVRGRFSECRTTGPPTTFRDATVVLRNDKDFILKVAAPFGQPCLNELVSRLTSLQRLRSFLGSLTDARLPVESFGLDKISFSYPPLLSAVTPSNPEAQQSQSFNAEFRFPSDVNDATAPTTFMLDHKSPHYRIRHLLQEHFDRQHSASCAMFISILSLTMPLLRALDDIETLNMEKSDEYRPTKLGIHCHDMFTYRLLYPQRGIKIDIHRERRRDNTVWVISNAALKHDPKLKRWPEPDGALSIALLKLFKERGNGWRGMSSCIETSTGEGTMTAVRRVDEVVRTKENGGVGELPGTVAAQAPSPKSQAPAPSKAPAKAQGKAQATSKTAQAAASTAAVSGKKAVGQNKSNVITLD